MRHSAALLSKRPIQRRGVGTDVPVGRRAEDRSEAPFATRGCRWSTCGQGGRAEGLEEGAAEKALSVARSLLAEGIAPETVAKCIGLPVEEVKALQKKV